MCYYVWLLQIHSHILWITQPIHTLEHTWHWMTMRNWSWAIRHYPKMVQHLEKFTSQWHLIYPESPIKVRYALYRGLCERGINNCELKFDLQNFIWERNSNILEQVEFYQSIFLVQYTVKARFVFLETIQNWTYQQLPTVWLPWSHLNSILINAHHSSGCKVF